MSSSLAYLLLLVVVALVFFLFRKKSPVETKGKPKPKAAIEKTKFTPVEGAPRKWRGIPDLKHQVVLDNVPEGYSPFWHSYNETDLRAKPKTGFAELISIAADVHMYDSDNNLADGVDLSNSGAINLTMSYTDDDISAAIAKRYSENDLKPVKLDPATDRWMKFPEGSFSVDKENRGATIAINSWGDPPIGWGAP